MHFQYRGMEPSLQGLGATEAHARLLYDTYFRVVGKPLISWDGSSDLWATPFEAPFMLLSHGTEENPILNYGNLRAQALWEMDWETFTNTPSRDTAEPMLQDQRERFLKEVQAKGFVENYHGVRISKTGKRFEIMDVTVWNLLDPEGVIRGQAAVFYQVNEL